MTHRTTDPRDGRVLEDFDDHDEVAVDRRLARAWEAHRTLRATPFEERAAWMRRAADLLEEEAPGTARTMTLEMGKPIAQARAEVAKSASCLRFYAEHAADLLSPRPHDAAAVGATTARVRYEPLGPVLAVMPWNFPLWQAIRYAAPGLMAGNPGLLKHASNVPRTAAYLGGVFARAGFPEGAFQHLFVGTDVVARILADDRVRAATLTGSERAGRAVAEIAGRELKPMVLELGGSDPFVVLPSADLDEAVRTGVTARCQNNGQSCIAAKRFVVHDDVYDGFVERFVEAMGAQQVGDPEDDAMDVGPLATEQGRRDVADAVEEARAGGADVLLGGTVPDEPGWWYPPTVVADVPGGTEMADGEVFGPVAAVTRVPSFAAAMEAANATRYGLGASVWTRDEGERERAVGALDAGMVFVNGMTASFPELPFGGIGASGYGRELAAEGIRAFCNAKTVWVA